MVIAINSVNLGNKKILVCIGRPIFSGKARDYSALDALIRLLASSHGDPMHEVG